MKNILRLTLVLLLVLAFGMTAKAEIINGAGATFPYPLYSKWFYKYEKNTGIKINYQSIGSGGGIQQVKAGTVDFGIYLGKVTKWTDQKIKEINPDLKIPDLPLIVVHRSDGSGTTNIFTWFLSDVNKEWETRVGSGTSVKWPVGLGGKGNEGVAGLVRQTRGAIGYVELAYALQTKMSYAMLRNRDGNFVYPTIETTKAAAATASVPPEFYVKFTYSKGKDSYPIAGFTYLILRKNMDRSKLSTILKFVEWAYKNGDGYAKELHYVPMPDNLKTKVMTALKKL